MFSLEEIGGHWVLIHKRTGKGMVLTLDEARELSLIFLREEKLRSHS